jgi:hypothetical protein
MADDDVEEFEEEDAAVNSNLERGQNMEESFLVTFQ